ncbi:hypothetical protein OG883_45820 [Streptomyces sp. NBC_01142]|uniref:hypothetical protein n=1 Tax=Streptomyces sp. NBC_01142 TaxID=2975865 RepID=UPI002258A116|nr:hypothetical protein [Streptomyces sp. NBC_01142]MCX4826304.1 hypothetical protein [Streptomyces sp. NBC_01142]MCX4826959.1 hypothetical protein [Streptomyces sp. NBC_01142]
MPRSEDTPDTYCIACADLADDHDQGEHDHDSHEFCPACLPALTGATRALLTDPARTGDITVTRLA